MAVAKLYGTFVLLLYLQENYAQQGLNNNQNVGVNSAIGFQQQPTQRTNTLNNVNQIPTGGLNVNVLQGNLQPNGGNIQQQLSLPANLQPQGGSGSLTNLQFNKQGLAQLPPGFVINPTKSQTNCPQINNVCNQNTPPQIQQNNVNVPFPNSLAELAALKGPSLLSLFASQINGQPQQNQPMANFSPTQNQLTDIQKLILARAIQGPNQPCNIAQPRSMLDSRPSVTIQGAPMAQQPQAIVTPVGQPPYIAVQAQPLPAYIQNQAVPVTVVEEPSALSFILSDIQPDAQYFYPPYQVQKRESKSNLKSLIPLIIDLLKEKNACGCRNCGCPNNEIKNNIPEPTIFGGYSNIVDNRAAENKKGHEDEDGKKESKGKKNLKKNVEDVDSEEASEEDDSDYEDDSTGD
ncbi:unnamed protein product [Spodoptera littoralis]|uniref:Uncharacterized protein n=1 Tax=Spodoptera littoralis TaxID=7109 RepID=A0A9P0N5L7_SPOLI|nr:unnamed protein product [Spodoptera littoralis]CAH1643293.1 unnamed protein product [Spodoptera littoralis]